MRFILPLLYFLLYNGTIVNISKRKFGECLPISLMLTAISLFISQFIFKTFQVGFILNILIAIYFIYILIREYKKDKLQNLKENYFTKGLLIFIIIFIFVYIFDFNRCFLIWDEYSHWGEMVKEMFRLDKFYSVEQSLLLVHKDYPPIVQLYELFWVKLCNGYSEDLLVKSIHILELSMFLPMLSEGKVISKLKNSFKSIIYIFIILLTMILFDAHNVVNTIYTDYLLGILVAYIVTSIIISKNQFSYFDLIKISIASIFLLLTKQMGLPLYLMILFVFIINGLIPYFKKNKININSLKGMFDRKYYKTYIKSFVFIFLLPILCYEVWNLYVDSLGIVGQFEVSDLKLNELINVVKGNALDYQVKAFRNFKAALSNYSLTVSFIPLSYISSTVLFLALIYFVCKSGKKYISEEKTNLVLIATLLGSIGYAVVMWVLYIFSFGPNEGPQLASYNRYMPTYILCGLFIALMLHLYIDLRRDDENNEIDFTKSFIIFLVLLFVQNPANIVKLYPCLQPTEMKINIEEIDTILNNTKDLDKVYILGKTDDWNYYMNYYINPRVINRYNIKFTENNLEEFIKEIENYEYLYVYYIDYDRIFLIENLFDKLEKGAIYKIEKHDEIKFVKIEA